jgi:septal ring factor EnvC (AmiA/AmiB activator)
MADPSSTEHKNVLKLSKKSPDVPDFRKINQYQVAILSLKTKLKEAKDIDDLTILSNKIIELEKEILVEKTSGHKKLEKEREEIRQKIDKIQRQLMAAQHDLERVNNSIELKTTGYKKVLEKKIEALSEEYSHLLSEQESMSLE